MWPKLISLKCKKANQCSDYFIYITVTLFSNNTLDDLEADCALVSRRAFEVIDWCCHTPGVVVSPGL